MIQSVSKATAEKINSMQISDTIENQGINVLWVRMVDSTQGLIEIFGGPHRHTFCEVHICLSGSISFPKVWVWRSPPKPSINILRIKAKIFQNAFLPFRQMRIANFILPFLILSLLSLRRIPVLPMPFQSLLNWRRWEYAFRQSFRLWHRLK